MNESTKSQDKTVKIIIFIVIGIVTCFLIIRSIKEMKCNYTKDYTKLLHPSFYPSNYPKYQYDKAKNITEGFLKCVIVPMEINGIVINKYKNECNRKTKTIDIENGQFYIKIFPTSHFGWKKDRGLYDEILVGDSIFKRTGSLVFKIKRDTFIREYKVSIYPEFWK